MALIEQKAAVSAISDLLMHQLKGERLPTWNEVCHAINDLTPVDAVPVVHGRWKIKTVREYDLSYGGRIYIPEYICGCCGHYYESYVRGDEPIMPEDADFPMYCEQCGAKMDGKDGNDDRTATEND